MIKPAISMCVLALALGACSSKSTIDISAKPIEIEIAKTADPAGVNMLPVTFKVVTKDTLDSFMAELSKNQNGTPVFVAFTMKDYENLVLNFADLKRYIEQQQSVIIYYRNMTAPKTN
jgi:hypothetical protein